MIEKLIEYSIKNRFITLLITLFVCLIGAYNVMYLSIDAVPDVTNVQVSVVTKSPGLSPQEVEQFITFPIETALNGIPKVTEIRSISRTGASSVTVIFEDSVDIYFARQIINIRLKQAEAQIPEGYGTPELSPISTGLGNIYEFTLTSDRHTPEELKTYMEWELYRKIKAIPGVTDLNVLGGELRQYQILLDAKKLIANKITLTDILEELKRSNRNVGGGYIQKTREQVVIRGEGLFNSIEDIEETAIRTSKDGIPLLLSQVATVKIGPALRFGVMTKNGEGEVIGGTIAMLVGENSRVVLKSIKKEMKKLEKKLPDGMRFETFYDRGDFIGETLGTVFTNLGEGAFLVFICLIVTLGSVKGAVLVASAIPISMLFAVIFMRMLGVVGNLMSLGAIDFGLLVDGSIVMLEALMSGFILKQHLFEKLTSKIQVRKLSQEIIKESCIRVARAAAFAVAIIMLVYLPLMALEGVEGRMFRPMAITVALALVGALLFSLTTFPAGLSYLYDIPEFHHSRYWDIIVSKYEVFINKAMNGPRRLYIASGFGLFIFSIFIAGFLGAEFIPRIYEGELSMDIKRLPSTAIDHCRDLNLEIEKVLMDIPEITSVISKQGRGESAAEPIGTEEAEMTIKVIPRTQSWVNWVKSFFVDDSKLPKEGWTSVDPYDLDGMMSLIQKTIEDNVPSSYVSVSQPIEDRTNELLSGSKADVVIKIYGEDLLKLKELATQVAGIVNTVDGVGNLRVQRVFGLPFLEIKVNREKMSRYGVKAHEILSTVETMKVGAVVGKVFEGIKRFDLVVRLDMDLLENNFELVHDIPVMTSFGTTVPLGLVADIRQVEGPAAIYREDLNRRIMVEVYLRGRDLVSFVGEAQEKTEELIENFPEGYDASWGGQFENFTRAKNRLAMVVPIALLIIFSMLVGAFGNMFYAIGVYSVVPFAVTGGVISLFLRGLPFSIPAGVGFIAVCGISVLNGVVYASNLKSLRLENPSDDIMKDVITSALGSVRPVITTALVAAIGFIPMAIAKGAGSEVQRPLASVVIGGIFTSTLLSGALLPMIMYSLLKRADALDKRIKKAIEDGDKYELGKH